MAAESQHQASESVDWSVWQLCVLLVDKCLVRLLHENCYQADIHHGMNYKRTSHYRCQHKRKREEKSMHDRESMNDQHVQSEAFNAGQQRREFSKKHGTIREQHVVDTKTKQRAFLLMPKH